MTDPNKNETVKILKEHAELLKKNHVLVKSTLDEFTRLMKIHAAQADLGNARRELIDHTLQKLLSKIAGVGEDSQDLLAALIKKQKEE